MNDTLTYFAAATAVIFACAAIALAIKILVVKKSLKEINEQLPRLVNGDTNAHIFVSSTDKQVRSLACSLNAQIKLLRENQLAYIGANDELKTAITNVAHDVRTPLTAICGYLDMIKDERDPEKARKYIEIMCERASALKTLSEELFKYSVAADFSREVTLQKVDVKSLLQETLLSFYSRFAEKNIVPLVNLPDAPLVKITDKNSLVRIFSNIIDNAIKYGCGDFAVTATEDGEISFSNTAEGLDSVNVGKLFDRFYTVDNCNYSTGLGLSIAKLLAKKIGGSISADLKANVLTITFLFGGKAG